MKIIKLPVQSRKKAEVFNAFSSSVFSNVKKQFGGYYGASHRGLKNKSEKDWNWNPGTTSTDFEKQLL